MSLKEILLALIVVSVIVIVSRAPSFQRIEDLTLDVRFEQLPRPDLADTNIVVVAIDNRTLDLFAENGLNWPWSRDTYAYAIRQLEAAGVNAILFDLLFFDADIERFETDSKLTDLQFSRALAASERSVIAAELIPDAQGDFNQIRLPLPLFADSANHIGATNLIPDAGGVIRRTHLWHPFNGERYPSIAVQTRIAAGDNRQLHLSDEPMRRIHWYGPPGPNGTFRYIPFSAVMFASIDSIAFLRGKTVVIGAYASGLLDFKPTPMSKGNAYPGMEIWATVLSNLAKQDFIRPVPIWAELFILVLMVTGTILFFRIPSVTASIIGILLLIAGYLMIAAWIWHEWRVPLPMVSPIIASMVAYGAIAAASYLTETKAKRDIRAVFTRYLHPDVIESLVRNPERVTFGGDMVNATILFTDIANFTTYSETKTADVLIQELNVYLSDLTEMVLDEGGLLDKFTGDGIMALFGVPIVKGNHAEMACRMALRHVALRNQLLDSDPPSKVFFHRHTRIGINTGDIIAGNIGSARRMDYTAIGDDVNLAARLEGVNKVYGTHIIIGENTRALLGDDFIVRELDSITVKGKSRPLRIFELVGWNVDLVDYSGIKSYEEALHLYRLGDFAKAKALFRDLPDPASAVMAERCEHLLTAHPIDWDGVYNLTHK